MDLALIDHLANRGDDGDRMANKSNPIYQAWAEPNDRGSGYIAVWMAPGLTSDIVRSNGRSPDIYPTREEAELAGWRRMAEVMNGPRIRANKQQGKPERYERLTGPQFAEALREARITPTFLAYLYGTSPHRVMSWIDGAEDVPHPIRILLALFKFDEGNIDVAEAVTDSVTVQRKPKREDTG